MPDGATLRVLESLAIRTGAELRRTEIDQRLRRRERLLRKIVQGTGGVTGDDFFHSLVSSLADALGVRYAFVSRFARDRTRVRTLAFWGGDHFLDSVEYDLAGTPCEDVLRGDVRYYPDNVAARFPMDQDLEKLGVESYLAVPLLDSGGDVVGHLAAMHVEPMPTLAEDGSVLRVFGARASAEIERLRTVVELEDSEKRHRDLFEEAPIAYVHEGLDSRFLRVNRTAMKVLGLKEDEVRDTSGASLVPDTPEAQARLKAALDALGRGAESSGVVLELRRKDDGRPLWIRWWSKPDPSGDFTRSMFIDITERMLLEQERNRLEAHNVYLREEIKAAHNFDEIVGASEPIRKVFDAVARVAPTDSSVLVTGETGTGKELIARAIHNRSGRRDRVLVKVNCAAIPAGLIESEMFGHERGAFTGALARKIGRFELADQGTIFLDEVGEIPLDLQSKLLRVLQEGEFERLGSTKTDRVDVRIIAA
ncbi:MAG: sigma 54-interacting transcriptional regulator, partial [Phycisphaerales bacterium]|nr:sigma 54-interacting transcriptional regulator [Phycisphaerales bacterium]